MADRDRRQKASDVFFTNPPVFGRVASSFKEAFPTIKSLRLVVEETDFGNLVRTYLFSLDHPPGEFLNCGNPRCYNGGIRIGQLLRFMIERGATHDELTQDCQGYEGSPKGRRNYGPCDRWFKLVVDVTYEPLVEQPPHE